MHDIKFIRKNSVIFDKAMINKGIEPCSEKILFIDNIVRKTESETQNLQHKKKEIAKLISVLKSSDENFYLLKKKGHEIKNQLMIVERASNEAKDKLNNLLKTLPNIIEEDVPCGIDEKDNKIIRVVGKPKNYNFSIRSHYDIGEKLGMMDFKIATKISGSRFVILKKDLVRLERALATFMLDIHVREFGFEEVLPPALVLEETMYNAGQLPKFNKESFKTTNGYRLIPTSEIPLVCMVSDRILNEYELPIRYVSYTQCFRSEAGSAGRDTKGMMRQHQFSKVELISIVKPSKSNNELERLTNAAERILQVLELPYRVSLLCAQDTGFCSQKTYDLEVWLPYEKKYREISSCSNCGNFQARRMRAKYKSIEGNKNIFVHTLNGSGLAIGRTMIAIIENYQTKNGSIMIPKKLQPFMQNQSIISVTK